MINRIRLKITRHFRRSLSAYRKFAYTFLARGNDRHSKMAPANTRTMEVDFMNISLAIITVSLRIHE